MKILLLGKNGQVGWELNRSLLPLGKLAAFGRIKADLSNPDRLRKIIQEIGPDVIVNAAAYTAVDKAEEEEAIATAINGTAVGVLAEETKKLNALLVHYSTDYVFDGTKTIPYTEDDEPNPINAYGRSKLAGEKAITESGCDHIILRTSWVYASRGHNFLLTILKLAKERDELSIIADQVGSPTSARLIAETTILCIKQAIKERQTGIFTSDVYHITSSNCTSWNGFAKEIINIINEKRDLSLQVKNIKEIPTKNYPTPAKRPMNSQLAPDKLVSAFGVEMPDWRKVLELCLEELMSNARL